MPRPRAAWRASKVTPDSYQSGAINVTDPGATSPYYWSILDGTLPTGLSLDAETGTISGTPTAGGTTSVTAGVTDAFGDTGSAQLTFEIETPPAFSSAKQRHGALWDCLHIPRDHHDKRDPAITSASGSSLPSGVNVDHNGNGTAALRDVLGGRGDQHLQHSGGERDSQRGPALPPGSDVKTAQVSLKFTGSITYVNSGSLTSGGFTVAPATGTITSVSGTGTIRGLKGGSATIKVAIEREPEIFSGVRGMFYVGYISVDDPGAHLNTVALVLIPTLTRVGSNGVSGVASGSTTPRVSSPEPPKSFRTYSPMPRLGPTPDSRSKTPSRLAMARSSSKRSSHATSPGPGDPWRPRVSTFHSPSVRSSSSTVTAESSMKRRITTCSR